MVKLPSMPFNFKKSLIKPGMYKNLKFDKKYLVQGVFGIIALIISHIVVSFLSKTIVNISNNKHIDDDIKKTTAFHMLQSTIYWVLMSICVIVILSFTGIQGAAVIAVLGSLLFAIGLGLQGTLGDLASGMMLIIGNVYKIGDYIEILDVGNGACVGTVKDFNVMYTRILDDDSSILINIPNRVIYNNVVKNHSSSDKHVVVESIIVSNRNKNLSNALEVLRTSVQNIPYVLDNPPVATNVASITENGTTIEIRYTIKASDYYISGTENVQGKVMTGIRETLYNNDIDLVIRDSAPR